MPWTYLDPLIANGWRIDWAFVPGRGRCIWDEQRIIIEPGLPWRLERSVLSHEAVHAERGPYPRWLYRREEEEVSRESARRLIPIRALAEALAWSLHADVVAEELDVDVPTLMARIRGLHPAERAFILRRTEHHRAHL